MQPVRLSPKFSEALAHAFLLHGRQERKGSGVPYIGHLLSTAGIVLHYGGDEDQAVAALLHDAAEDQGGRETLKSIGLKFGSRVARIIEGCTDTFENPKPPWRPRKEQYIKRLAAEETDTLLVSAADKLDNARAIIMDLRAIDERGQARDGLWSRFKGGREGTLWYYREIAAAYPSDRVGPICGELKATVSELDRLAAIGRA